MANKLRRHSHAGQEKRQMANQLQLDKRRMTSTALQVDKTSQAHDKQPQCEMKIRAATNANNHGASRFLHLINSLSSQTPKTLSCFHTHSHFVTPESKCH